MGVLVTMKRFAAVLTGVVTAVALGLVACAPTTSSQPSSVNRYFDVTVNGQPVPHRSDAASAFVYRTDAFVLAMDLGTTEWFGGTRSAVEGVRIALENDSDGAVKILWDDSTFVDPSGSSSRIFHFGVKYTDRNNSLPPTVVAPHARVDEGIYPTDYAHYGPYSGWYSAPIVSMASVADTTFRVYLVLEVNGAQVPLDIMFQGKTLPKPAA